MYSPDGKARKIKRDEQYRKLECDIYFEDQTIIIKVIDKNVTVYTKGSK